MKIRILKLSLFVWFFGPYFCSSGQSNIILGQANIQHFSNENYNASRQNWGIAQSPVTGIMYFANSKGLLEYDGSVWKLYESPSAIRSIFIDDQGKIFTGALGEFGYWQQDSFGRLIYHSLKTLVPGKDFAQEAVWNIISTEEGVLFQSFAYVYLYRNNQVKKLTTPGNVLFVHQVDNRLYVEGLNKGIFELKNEKFTLVEGSEFLGKTSVHAFLPGSKPGEILVCTDKGVFVYNEKGFSPFGGVINSFFQHNQLNRAIVLDKDRYAFGTILDGVVITNGKGEILNHYNKKNGLQNNTVLSLKKDRSGDLWIGLDNGIDLINLNLPVKYYSDAEGSIGTVFDAALHEGKLYIGTNHGVFVATPGSAKPDFKLIPQTQGQVWDLEVIDGQLLCGHNNGTFRISNLKAELVSTITGGWVIKKLKKHPDFLIQGTYTKLCLYQKDAGGKWRFLKDLDGLSAPVNQLEEDSEGNIWVNFANKGIASYKLNLAAGKVERLEVFEEEAFRTSTTNLGQIGNKIIVTTPIGIYSYDSGKKTLTQDKQLNQQRNLRQIVKLFVVSPKVLLAIDKNKALGLIENDSPFKEIPIRKNKWVDGSENIVILDAQHLLFCAEDGFAVMPESILSGLLNEKIEEPMIRAALFPDNPSLNRYFYHQKNERYYYDYDQNSLMICFSSPVYDKAIQYSFWLEGYSNIWSDYAGINKKEYSNLPPGTYTFHVRSNLSDLESTFSFEISSPWYWNMWSKTIYLFLLAGLFFWLYQLHLKRLKTQKDHLRESLEQKHKEQEEKNQQEIIRLRNEQLESDIIRKSEELANSMMTLIKKNELLGKIKEEVEHTTKSPKQILSLIEKNISTEHDWKVFESNFNKVHEAFLKRLVEEYPDLTHGDLKLAAYLRMNLSTKEIAQLLNITMRSVELKRYRLRQKLNLNTEENLADFILKF